MVLARDCWSRDRISLCLSRGKESNRDTSLSGLGDLRRGEGGGGVERWGMRCGGVRSGGRKG